MGRKPTVDAERILAAARELFFEKGVRATTAEVARRAKVSEGSIFNHFPTKDVLFREAMQIGEPPWVATLAGRVGKGSIDEALVGLGGDLIAFFRTLLPMVMLSWSNAGAGAIPEILAGPNPLPLRALRGLAGYFEAEMRLGRIARHDPEIVARAFVGAIQNFVLIEIITRSPEVLPLPAETFLRGVVNLLLRGLHPTEKKMRRRS